MNERKSLSNNGSYTRSVDVVRASIKGTVSGEHVSLTTTRQACGITRAGLMEDETPYGKSGTHKMAARRRAGLE